MIELKERRIGSSVIYTQMSVLKKVYMGRELVILGI